ncbi:MAG: mechanosensitive ion channel domain-containing protein, partial [Pseudomonadota bacterium]
IDVGLQNSLKTLIGYVGLLIALMTGVSILGFNLANLAIIAGAMSVGIGFGLQSIVNNFVSGLILLFERPTKVGDWIVVPSGEGHVKSVNVRSTEIETFDRSSIIVPNSELISGSVQN